MDHVSNYRAPQESEDVDDVTRELQEKGCGANTPPSSSPEVSEDEDGKPTKKHKKGGVFKLRRRFWVVLVSSFPACIDSQ